MKIYSNVRFSALEKTGYSLVYIPDSCRAGWQVQSNYVFHISCILVGLGRECAFSAEWYSCELFGRFNFILIITVKNRKGKILWVVIHLSYTGHVRTSEKLDALITIIFHCTELLISLSDGANNNNATFSSVSRLEKLLNGSRFSVH